MKAVVIAWHKIPARYKMIAPDLTASTSKAKDKEVSVAPVSTSLCVVQAGRS